MAGEKRCALLRSKHGTAPTHSPGAVTVLDAAPGPRVDRLPQPTRLGPASVSDHRSAGLGPTVFVPILAVAGNLEQAHGVRRLQTSWPGTAPRQRQRQRPTERMSYGTRPLLACAPTALGACIPSGTTKSNATHHGCRSESTTPVQPSCRRTCRV